MKMKGKLSVSLLIVLIFISGCVELSKIEQQDNGNVERNYDDYDPHYDLRFDKYEENDYITVYGIDRIGVASDTHSMEPAEFGGYILLMQNYNGRILRKGEIIIFQNPYKNETLLLGHRVQNDNGYLITTCGDNVKVCESFTDRNLIKHVQVGILYT